MLSQQLAARRVVHPEEQFCLIFHTSAILFDEEDLVSVYEGFPHVWAITDDCYYEVQLLTQSRAWGKKAARFLELFGRKLKNDEAVMLSGDLEEVYEDYIGFFTALGEIPDGYHPLFVIGSLCKLYEFLEKVSLSELNGNGYVLFHNEWRHSACGSATERIMSLEDAKIMARKLKMASGIKYTSSPAECAEGQRRGSASGLTLRAKNGPDNTAAGTVTLGSYIGGGGEGTVYATDKPELAAKIYTARPSANRISKLRCLSALQPAMPFVKMPRHILYRDGNPVGYTMDKVLGVSLSKRLTQANKVFDTVDILHQLGLMLLEMNLYNCVAVDLAFPNLMITDEDRLFMIDSDSLQFRDFSAGVLPRTDFLHKDYTDTGALFQPYQQNFSFLVLAFKLIVCGDSSPLFQAGIEEEELRWGKAAFPYELYGQMEDVKIAPFLKEIWQELSMNLKLMFVCGFHHYKSFSVGSILKTLKAAEDDENILNF